MKPFPNLILFITAAAAYALPVDPVVSGILLFTAGLGAVICIDYSHRYRGLRVPRLPATPAKRKDTRVFRAPPLPLEPNRLAA